MISVIDSSDRSLTTAPSLPLALQARMPGVGVSQSSGLLGSSSRVWLRGPSGLAVNEPLLIIDGVRTHAAQTVRGFEARELPSRLEDIDPENIERVEVLRGAAASAMYGPGSSKGVILVTTKRGAQGPARWSAFAESGPMSEATTFATNHGTLGVSTVDGTPVANCPLSAQGAGTCTPTTRSSWNPLESASPFRTGWSNGAGLTVAGGTATFTYRAAASHDRATGVYANDRGHATSAAGNFSVALSPTLDFRVSGMSRAEKLRHPSADAIGLGLMGAATDDPLRRGYADRVDAIERVGRRTEDARRLTASVGAHWQPRDWLRASAIVGYDELRVEHRSTQRWGRAAPGQPDPGDSTTIIQGTLDRPGARTATVEVEGARRLRSVSSRTTVGTTYQRDDDRGRSFERMFTDENPASVNSSTSSYDARRGGPGVYARQHFAWERLFITGSLRADFPERSPIGNILSHSVDASWIAIGSGRTRATWIDELRLRAAYGDGGGHLIPTAVDDGTMSGGGASDETAERMREIELGADASFLARRLQVEVTLYRANNDQGLSPSAVPPPSSGGFASPVPTNDARFTTSGMETRLAARLIETARLTWRMGLGLAIHETEIRSMPGLAFFGDGDALVRARSIGEVLARPYSFADANGDGLIAPSEVAVSGNVVSAGVAVPDYVAALRTDALIAGRVRIAAVLDQRQGQKLYDGAGALRCSFNPRCAAQHVPGTSLTRQAEAVAGRTFPSVAWVEDGSYTKLREVTIGLDLPRAWMGAAHGARLTLSGRNLATWTSYQGLDPEIMMASLSAVAPGNVFGQPPLRAFNARIDLVW